MKKTIKEFVINYNSLSPNLFALGGIIELGPIQIMEQIKRGTMKRKKSFLLTISILLMSIYGHSQHDVDPAWSNNVELPTAPASNSSRGFLYSNMAVFSNNKRVVFINKMDGISGIYHTHSYDGLNWSVPVLFEPSDLVIGLNSPKLVKDQNDTLHVIWGSQSPKVLYYTKMDSALNVISDTVRITDNPEYGSFNDMYISVDMKDRIHLMWNEGKTGSSDKPESFYSNSINGGDTWLPKIMLSVDDDIPSSFPRGQFNACNGDTLAIFWRDSSLVFSPSENWNLKMTVSTDGGVSWGSPVEVNPWIGMQGDPDLVIDPYGRWHLFYHEASPSDPYWGMRVVYAYSDDLGENWNPSDFTDTISYAERSYLAEGSRYDVANDVLWTFWKEEDIIGLQGGDMMAAYSLDRGESWSEPQYVTDRNDTTIGFKAVDLMPDGGVAINYELPNYPSAGNFRVFYKERGPVVVAEIEEQAIDNLDILVYPNPARDKVYFRSSKEIHSVQLFNVQGKLVREYQLVDGQIDLPSGSSGLFYLHIFMDRDQIVKKVVVNP